MSAPGVDFRLLHEPPTPPGAIRERASLRQLKGRQKRSRPPTMRCGKISKNPVERVDVAIAVRDGQRGSGVGHPRAGCRATWHAESSRGPVGLRGVLLRNGGLCLSPQPAYDLESFVRVTAKPLLPPQFASASTWLWFQ